MKLQLTDGELRFVGLSLIFIALGTIAALYFGI